MRLIHLSDLHLGKRVNGFSMLEDQKYILKEILQIISDEQPDGVILAGDIYDKSVPPAEAVELFDEFLTDLAGMGQKVFVISGNHDSPERLAFGNRLMDVSGIHLSPVYDGTVTPFELADEHGTLAIWMLPFLKPAHVRRFFPEEEITSYTDAMAVAINAIGLDTTKRNVLITHQFVTGAERSESEEISVGGTDNVDASVFDGFDYVALGHIHGPQNAGGERIRYCGTPLKYSFSEAGHKKSVTVVELREKGDLSIRTVPLQPYRDMREIRGSYEEVTARSFWENTSLNKDYLHVTLTDEEDVPDAAAKLRMFYPYLMKLDYDNARTRSTAAVTGVENIEEKSPLELVGELYEQQNNAPMIPEQEELIRELIEKIWEEEA